MILSPRSPVGPLGSPVGPRGSPVVSPRVTRGFPGGHPGGVPGGYRGVHGGYGGRAFWKCAMKCSPSYTNLPPCVCVIAGSLQVDAAVVSFSLRHPSQLPAIPSTSHLFLLIDLAFQSKRKMLRNTLQSLHSAERVEAALQAAGLPNTVSMPFDCPLNGVRL